MPKRSTTNRVIVGGETYSVNLYTMILYRCLWPAIHIFKILMWDLTSDRIFVTMDTVILKLPKRIRLLKISVRFPIMVLGVLMNVRKRSTPYF